MFLPAVAIITALMILMSDDVLMNMYVLLPVYMLNLHYLFQAGSCLKCKNPGQSGWGESCCYLRGLITVHHRVVHTEFSVQKLIYITSLLLWVRLLHPDLNFLPCSQRLSLISATIYWIQLPNTNFKPCLNFSSDTQSDSSLPGSTKHCIWNHYKEYNGKAKES